MSHLLLLVVPHDLHPPHLLRCHRHTHAIATPSTLIPPLMLFLPLLLQFVVVLFWGLYHVDQEMVYPHEVELVIPSILNHFWHTAPLLLVFLELLVVFHRYPSNTIATCAVLGLSTSYIVWIVWVFTNAAIWPYPFFKLIPLPALPIFFIINLVIITTFYFVGKWGCYLRWKGEGGWLCCGYCISHVVSNLVLYMSKWM